MKSSREPDMEDPVLDVGEGDVDAHRPALQAFLGRRELGRQIRERPPAGGVRRALVEEQAEGALGVPRIVERHLHVGGDDAAQDGAAHVARIAAHVDQGGAGAVGAAVEVDALVAEGGADVVQVVHRDRRRVERGIGGEPPQALSQRRHRQHVVHVALRVVVAARQRAVEGIRAAGAALVDQHDVAVGEHPGEDAGERLGGGDRRLAGAADQDEQRIGSGGGAQRRQHRHPEPDPAPLPGGAVLEHLERAAARLPVDAGELARRERQPRRGGRGRRARRPRSLGGGPGGGRAGGDHRGEDQCSADRDGTRRFTHPAFSLLQSCQLIFNDTLLSPYSE